MMNRLRRVLATSEAGLTMVELLVYMILSVVVLGIGGNVLISSLQAQRDMSNLADSTSLSQLVTSSVRSGIRNSSAFEVATPTALGQLVRSRSVTTTSAGVSTWACRAWYLTASGTFYQKTSTTGTIAAPTVIGDLSTWQMVTSGLSVPTGTSQAFTGSAGQVDLAIQVTNGSTKAVLSKTTIVARPQANTLTVPTTCF
jgi:type II secretory pathway pseudopilin PulG